MVHFTRTAEPFQTARHNLTVTPIDFCEIPFTPALLLPHTFDASLVADPEFSSACEDGFDSYFAVMYGRDEQRHVTFTNRFYTLYQVKSEVIHNAFPDASIEPTPLAWRAGFLLGWLSALALTDRALALQGAALLAHLIEVQIVPMAQYR